VVVQGDRQIRLSAIRDLSEHKRYEREQQRLISELRARNEEMEQFVYTVSHDLKSPLVTIKGFVGAIGAALDADRTEHVRSDLARIGRAADRMTELLGDLLELSRAGRAAARATTVPLEEVARSAVELVQGAADARGVTIAIGELPAVAGDRGRLQQVLQNLLENAIKYLGDQPQPRVEIGAREGGETPGRAVVFVRDNGKGIAPEHRERVFGLFEKLDPRSEGTGVGLALVQRIVASHGGKVWLESEGLGRGCTFVVELPLGLPVALESAVPP
jgi:signal transduction histidine kinase